MSPRVSPLFFMNLSSFLKVLSSSFDPSHLFRNKFMITLLFSLTLTMSCTDTRIKSRRLSTALGPCRFGPVFTSSASPSGISPTSPLLFLQRTSFPYMSNRLPGVSHFCCDLFPPPGTCSFWNSSCWGSQQAAPKHQMPWVASTDPWSRQMMGSLWRFLSEEKAPRETISYRVTRQALHSWAKEGLGGTFRLKMWVSAS